jgi:hypothetical protein
VSYAVQSTPKFLVQAKRLAGRYHSILDDLERLVDTLSEHPTQGAPLGSGLYKVRLAIKSKNKGKSGGARVITFVYTLQEEVYLLALYDKSEQEDLTSDEIGELRAIAHSLQS